jgi:hypothetical protein
MREADVLKPRGLSENVKILPEKTKTCGECKHFLPDRRWICDVQIPLWAARVNSEIWVDTDASDCKCFERRGGR